MDKIYSNKWDKVLIILIVSLSLGSIGGAIQIIRIISVVLFFPNIYLLFRYKIPSTYIYYFLIIVLWLFIGYYLLYYSITPEESKIEWIYIFIHSNISLSIINMGRFANKPYSSLLNGWILFCGITLSIGLIEVLFSIHMPTNSTQTLMSESGIKLNGVMDKRYAAAFFNNYNEYMTALSFAFPFLFSSLCYFTAVKKQLLIWCIILASFVVVIISASRGAIICFGLSLVISLCFYKDVNFPYKKMILRSTLIFGIVGIILFAGILFADLLGRLDRSNGDAMEDLGRIAIYEQTLSYFSESNHIGLGAYGIQARLGFATHNLWLEILCQYGWLVFMSIMIIMFSQIYKAFRLSKKMKSERCCIVTAIATLPAVSVINSGYLIYPFLWVNIGCLLLITQNLMHIQKIYKNDPKKNSLLLVR